MSSGDILTKRDVAELLQVSERTVERRMSEGSIPYVPLPQTRRLVGSSIPSTRNRRFERVFLEIRKGRPTIALRFVCCTLPTAAYTFKTESETQRTVCPPPQFLR